MPGCRVVLMDTSLIGHFIILAIKDGRRISDGFATREVAESWVEQCPMHERANVMIIGPSYGPMQNPRPAGYQYLTEMPVMESVRKIPA